MRHANLAAEESEMKTYTIEVSRIWKAIQSLQGGSARTARTRQTGGARTTQAVDARIVRRKSYAMRLALG